MVVAQYKSLGTQSRNNFSVCLSLLSAVDMQNSAFSSNFLNKFLYSSTWIYNKLLDAENLDSKYI